MEIPNTRTPIPHVTDTCDDKPPTTKNKKSKNKRNKLTHMHTENDRHALAYARALTTTLWSPPNVMAKPQMYTRHAYRGTEVPDGTQQCHIKGPEPQPSAPPRTKRRGASACALMSALRGGSCPLAAITLATYPESKTTVHVRTNKPTNRTAVQLDA